jgi:hypothetical protein
MGEGDRVRSLFESWERTVTLGVSELQRRFDGEPTGSSGVCRLAPCRYSDQNRRTILGTPASGGRRG